MKKTCMSGALLCLQLLCYGQEDSARDKRLDEVIIYSGKFPERRKNIVQKIDVISAARIAQLNSQNTGDLLINTGNVFVQKSQQGGSSPVIRGFEASRVLLVVDGVRMNNAIYRSGHLQNVITVDQNMLERVEVLYGPASTLYGSDALGGVVLLRTKTPALSPTGKILVTGSGFTRFSSANREKTVHADAGIGSRKWAWLQSYNYSDFGDLRMGRNYPDAYPGFGRRSRYVATVNGVDTVLNNEDDRVQKFSGYRQWDVLQKVLFRPGPKVTHALNLQYSSSSDVPRYDRLQDMRNGTLRFASWYYGPQERSLASYELSVGKPGFFDEFRTLVAFQHIRESRHTREYRRYDRLDNRIEDLGVWNFTTDGRKLWKQHELTLGIDGQWNSVRSTAYRENVLTGSRSGLDTRYPNGTNRMDYYGVYGQHVYKHPSGKWVLNDGLRIQAVRLHSTIRDNSFFQLPFTEIRQRNLALTGNLGLVYLPVEGTRITFGLSSGFRNPNIDDLARIFESNTASRQLIVPNPDIRPEYTYNADLGFSRQFGGRLRLEATGFYTLFRNAISLVPFRWNGQDSLLYNGMLSQVFANGNTNRAYLYGANAGFTWNPGKALQLFQTLNYTYGRLRPQHAAEVPLDHIPPLYGKTGLQYRQGNWQAEAYSLYNGWKRVKDYHPSGEDNLQYATPEGTPAWYTLNLKGGCTLGKRVTLQAGVENLLDRNYRYFASGFSAPGRNVIVALRAAF